MISVIILYKISGNDYSIGVSLLVFSLDCFVIPCVISVNQCIISNNSKSNNKIDKRKIIALILISVLIISSIAALIFDDNSMGVVIKLYVIPILVYSIISLVNIIINLHSKSKIQT